MRGRLRPALCGLAVLCGGLALPPEAVAGTGPVERCFSAHLLEAVQLNRERAPAYAAVTGGASRVVSEWLVLSELAILPLARWFEMREAPYRRAGISILCDAFVSMDHAPALLPRVPPPVERWTGPTAPAGLPREARRAYGRYGLAGVDALLSHALESDPDGPYDCMVRHLLESAIRVTRLAPEQARRAAEAGLPPPERLQWDLVRAHLAALRFGAWLDARAAPMQAEGVPLICRDVPPVPLPTG